MMFKSNRFFHHLALIATILCALTTASWAQGTAFTYQSRLNDNGALANGNYDLQFSLFDAVNGGTQIGTTLNKPGVAIANGVFIVQLDFGATAFTSGGQRFLQIAVRPAGTSDPYTTLNPRTEITSTPHAIRSLSAATADNATQLNGTNASQYVQTNDARLSDARDPKPGSASYIQNTTVAQAGNFNLTGSGRMGSLFTTNITAETGAFRGLLSANTLDASTQFNLGGNRVLSSNNTQDSIFLGVGAGQDSVIGTRNTAIGYRAGQAYQIVSGDLLVGSNNTFLGASAGNGLLKGSNNTMIGNIAGLQPLLGNYNTMLGVNSNVGMSSSNATAIGANTTAKCSNCVVLGDSNANTGIGTDAPLDRLHVEGGNIRWNASLLSKDQGGSIELGGSDVGAGTGTPYIDFHFNGQLQDYNVRLINNQSGRLQLIGQFQATSVVCASNVPCSSDARLKEQVKPLSYGLSQLLQLRPVRWQWKDRTNSQLAVGMIAQEVEQVMPELLLRDPNPDGPLGLNYVGFVPVIIKAVQEQQTLLEQKDAALKALQQDNAALQARLAAVEQALQQMQTHQAPTNPNHKQQ